MSQIEAISFRHCGLKALYEGRASNRFNLNCISRLRDILAVIDASRGPEVVNLPGYDLHQLKGERKGYYAIKVSGNWRVTFRFEDARPVDVDNEDYD